jgi:hypothetical protein
MASRLTKEYDAIKAGWTRVPELETDFQDVWLTNKGKHIRVDKGVVPIIRHLLETVDDLEIQAR